MAQKGLLIVISGPSGVGKHTVTRKLWETERGFVHSVSATTRPPRKGEEDGKDYYFLSREEFERRAAANEFVEWAEVHGHLYGTLRSELERCQASDKEVVLELDVQGMRNLRRLGHNMISVFIMPPSPEELERRLRARGTDSDEVIAVRLANAQSEVAARGEFDYVVVNDRIDRAVADLAAILRAERRRTCGQQP